MDQEVAFCILNTVGKELKANRFVKYSIVNTALLYINYIKTPSLKKSQSKLHVEHEGECSKLLGSDGSTLPPYLPVWDSCLSI